MDVFPDFGAVGGALELKSIVGALLTFVLIIAVLMMIVSGVSWALASAHGNFHTATRARLGLLSPAEPRLLRALELRGSTSCSVSG